MHGPDILIRTLSVRQPIGQQQLNWNYHSRSDRHSKVSVWGVLYDLLHHCSLLRRHASDGKIAFGINHEIRDFQQNQKKDLDLVVCTPRAAIDRSSSFGELATHYDILLSDEEKRKLGNLPALFRADVGSVLIALEAKACMTEHLKARPRLHNELNSSHLTIHGADANSIAAGLVMINAAAKFVSPIKNPDQRWPLVYNVHKQPSATNKVIEKVSELPRRSSTQIVGFDALGIVVVDCKNDGSQVALINAPPAPARADIHHYDMMIHRLSSVYSSRFSTL